MNEITLGDVSVTRVEEMHGPVGMTPEQFFPGWSAEDWRENSEWLVPDHLDAASNIVQVAALWCGQFQGGGDRVEHLRGGVPRLPLLEPCVVGRADPGELRQLLAAQTGHAPSAAVRGQPQVLGLDPRPARLEERPELPALITIGHTAIVRRRPQTCLTLPGCGWSRGTSTRCG